MKRIFVAALASAVALLDVGERAPVLAQNTLAPAVAPVPVIDARFVRARRTATGYTLTGQALVKDACTSARFDQYKGNVFPPLFNLDQDRRPGTFGLLCVARRTWVTAMPKVVSSSAPPHWISVHTQKGTSRVPTGDHRGEGN
jgi:hypothetical protein